jgi:hypothetical protein
MGGPQGKERLFKGALLRWAAPIGDLSPTTFRIGDGSLTDGVHSFRWRLSRRPSA